MKTRIPPLLITFALVCFALVQNTRAVVPAPDGGYPGGNTAEGHNALLGLTSGTYNTAVGVFSLESNTTGSFNTATGAGALLLNTADANTATGAGALFSNLNGPGNTANGTLALFHNTSGSGNTAIGSDALLNSTTGSSNTAIGRQALASNSTGSYNIALGQNAGQNLTTGDSNIDIGNAGVAGENSTIRIGDSSQTAAFIAELASFSQNAAFIFGLAQISQSATLIAGISGVNEGFPNTAVYINTNTNQLGTQPPASSRRFKKEVKPMEQASEAILSLKPVTFHYKGDTKGTPQFGLIAEEVAKVNPGLVLPDKEGKPYTVRYDAVNAMLLNEFLKEHRTVQELKKEVAALTAGLRKVSAQLEARKPAPQVVNNP
jgi:hypothetical protein